MKGTITMKVLLCERVFSGHRKTYLQGLTQISGVEFFSYAPENAGVEQERFFQYNTQVNPKSFIGYYSWIKQIRQIVKQNQIDVVHFLDGDSLMRFFGLGMHSLGTQKVIITFHHFFVGFLRKISYRIMSSGKGHISVVHTRTLQEKFRENHIKNVEHCEYPAFDCIQLEELNTIDCKEKWGLDTTVPVIGIVGGMAEYKNIVPFLKVMQKCRKPFQLLIGGRLVDIEEGAIRTEVKSYDNRTILVLRSLSIEEYREAIMASDIVYCLYGKGFDGASGPLTDGVCGKKMILASNHGSLGQIVMDYHVGITADVDDEADILRVVNTALENAMSFEYDEKAEEYRRRIHIEGFRSTYKAIYERS